MVDDGCLSTVGTDGSLYSVGGNTIVNETGDASVTASFNVPLLNSRSSSNKSVT